MPELKDQPNLGYIVLNRHGRLCSYVNNLKSDGVRWVERWDKQNPEDAPHVIAALIPVEE